MRSNIQRLYKLLIDEGAKEALRRTTEYGLRNLYLAVSDNPMAMYSDTVSAVAAEQDINICHNKYTKAQYDPSSTNVLIATESPALVEAENWLDSSFEFHAEFSFGDFYGLDNFYPLRRFHAGRDYRVELDLNETHTDKSELVSLVFADKDAFEGQAMRHRVAANHNIVDAYGSGVGPYLYDKAKSLAPYRFQIVIEACKHPEYVSEKFFDCLKTNTIPIYWGGREAIEKMGFDTDAILFFEDEGELASIIDDLSPEVYEERREHAVANRERLVEIRNQLKSEFYLGRIRLGFLLTDDDEEFESTRPHLRFE